MGFSGCFPNCGCDSSGLQRPYGEAFRIIIRSLTSSKGIVFKRWMAALISNWEPVSIISSRYSASILSGEYCRQRCQRREIRRLACLAASDLYFKINVLIGRYPYMIKRLLLVGILFMTMTNTKGQTINCPPCHCSQLIRQLATGWKNDSLTTSGYRFNNYKKLLKCDIDNVSPDLLLGNFGKPLSVNKTNRGTEYLYLFYDETPRNPKKNFIRSISFFFNDQSRVLVDIMETDY